MIEWFKEYDAVIKVAATALVLLLAAWAANREKPKVSAGWTYLHYTMLVKVIAGLFLPFMIAAILYNGSKLFEESWWVPPVIFLTTAGAAWLFYDSFFRTIRWNSEALEVRGLFSKGWRVAWEEVRSVSLVSEALFITDVENVSRKLNLHYRVGARDLIQWLSSRPQRGNPP
ncbi:hypothetical protein GIW81_01945 [Hyphomicrobium sp. xq]|uniref:Uncharacterized protein n=1 Tax=Hyphomicrobium album TaxID=2665159 RepID=A0A6I3KHE7_9HYPH|nr:hypothetical protein [Hyphomicrobium album]MTD93092.1 hypothetical protein [Hyphomicrobium album]